MGGELRGSAGRWTALGVVTAAVLMLAGDALAQEAGAPSHGPSAVAQAPAEIQAVAAFQPVKPGADPPAAVAAAKAYAVLQSACARCHQADRADHLPAGNLGNILDLDALAREPGLVQPGLPDASRLYTMMLDHHLPLDVFSGAHADGLSPIEIEAVRATVDVTEIGEINPEARPDVALNLDSESLPVTRSNGVLFGLLVPRGSVLPGAASLVAFDGFTREDACVVCPAAVVLEWPQTLIDRSPDARTWGQFDQWGVT